jgi:hypothetical protein
MIKFVCEYADEEFPSIYAKGITEGITMGFKKKNRTIT